MTNLHKKNKLKTAGYFIKRLKDNGFVTLRIFDQYTEADPRKWTILVDPAGASVFVTCFENTPFKGEYLFNFDDGNQNFKGNFSLRTDSIEVIVQRLLSNNVGQKTNSKFLTK
jgi:hypothetical protein|tara:strand:- start:1300 stop:1638 length:339 start_codon:yes stop_codon:yes gene_type:complete